LLKKREENIRREARGPASLSTRVLWVAAFGALAVGCSAKPAAIDVSPHSVKIYGLQRNQRLAAALVDKKGRPMPGALQWSSSKASVVTVDGGKLQSKGEGRAIITVSFQQLSASVPVEVIDVKTVEIVPATAHLVGPAGTTLALSAVVKNSKDKPSSRPVTWRSLAPRVAAVSADGLVTSVAPGKAGIVAKVGDVEAVSEVVVSIGEVTRLEIRPATALVRVGDSQRFETIAYGPDGKPYESSSATFQSSHPQVATVDASGMAAGLAAGTTTIRATVAGVAAEATLIVTEP
jgi:uncharacterized protein YjdB